VTATGLSLQLLGGMTVAVDDRTVDPADTVAYKGMMYSGVPNLAVVSGYTNASWTLKADLVCEYVCRLLNHMQKAGSISRRATSSAPSTSSPSRARAGPGASTRTTLSIS
jgi:monooxygenase